MTPTLGKYDQVLALTQQMVNTGLRGLYKNSERAKDPIERAGDREVSLRDFVFDVPEIIVPHNPESTNRSKFLLVIWIKSGKLRYYKTKDDDDATIVDAAGLAFAIPTDLGGTVSYPLELAYTYGLDAPELQDITDPKKLADLKKEFNVGNDYSIGRLLVSMRKAAQSTLDPAYSKLPAIPKVTFNALAANLCEEGGILDEELSTLGYTSRIIDPSLTSHPPEFKPNSTRFQAYSWVDPSTEIPAGTGVLGNSVLNYLLYNQTTGKNPQPKDNEGVWLIGKQNWTPGRAENNPNDASLVLGRFYICKKNFFDNWLIPKLGVINEAMHLSVCNLGIGAWWDSTYKLWCNVQMRNSPKSGGGPSSWIAKEGSQKNVWEWQFDYNQNPDWQKGGPATISIAAEAHAKNKSSVSFVAGKNRITMKGEGEMYLYCEVWRGVKDLWGTISRADRYKRKLTWQIDFDLESVKDGGLQIKVNTPTFNWDTSVRNQNDLGYVGWFKDWMDAEGPKLKDHLTAIEGPLASDLSDVHKLYFPAGGLFYYANPTINENGDLMVDVKYAQDALKFKDRPERSVPTGSVDTTPVAGNVDPGKKKAQGQW